jgi:hypothetical protein
MRVYLSSTYESSLMVAAQKILPSSVIIEDVFSHV